jgi:hypothetical protein
MSRFLPTMLVLLFGLLVLNVASDMAYTADCHAGDHTPALAQASSECQTEASHLAVPCGMWKPCTPSTCMASSTVDGPQDLHVLADKSLFGWVSAVPLHGWIDPPPVEPPRTRA